MTSRIIRNTLLAATSLAAIGVVASACAGKKSSEEGDPRCDEAVVPYEGYATDESCKAMLDAEDAGQVQVGTADAPTVATIGSNGAISSTASTLTISWSSPIDLDGNTFLFTPRPHRLARVAHRDLGREILSLLAPESVAWAHLPPVTGALHMVRIKGIAGQSDPKLLFTTRLSIALSSSSLAPILATTTPMQVEVTDAYLTENRIDTPATDGPFRAATDTSFHVQ